MKKLHSGLVIRLVSSPLLWPLKPLQGEDRAMIFTFDRERAWWMCLLLSVVSFIQPTSIVMMLSCVVDVNMKKSKMQIVKDNQSKRYCTSTTNGNRNHHHYHYQLLYCTRYQVILTRTSNLWVKKDEEGKERNKETKGTKGAIISLARAKRISPISHWISITKSKNEIFWCVCVHWICAGVPG